MKGEATARTFAIIALMIVFFVFMFYLLQRTDYSLTEQIKLLPGLFK